MNKKVVIFNGLGIFLLILFLMSCLAGNASAEEKSIISSSEAITLVNEKYIPQTISEFKDIKAVKSEEWLEK